MNSNFELLAFYSNPETLEALIESGIDGIIVDWENKGKSIRQNLYNTQVNEHTSLDLEFVGKKDVSNLICRINGPDYWSKDEIDNAIDLGAKELLVPMVKSVKDVEFVLNQVNGRVDVGIMIETNEALTIVDQFNNLPIHRFFVGLNDLSIQRKSKNIFLPLIDGTIDEIRPKISKPFGIAGLTHPNAGHPIPCSYLIKQMKRYDASFGFLRRSFYKDLDVYNISEVINALRETFNKNVLETCDLTSEEKHLFSQDLI